MCALCWLRPIIKYESRYNPQANHVLMLEVISVLIFSFFLGKEKTAHTAESSPFQKLPNWTFKTCHHSKIFKQTALFSSIFPNYTWRVAVQLGMLDTSHQVMLHWKSVQNLALAAHG